ncbi:metal-sensitive transcriptional regulator [Promicromonospora kroppenstedtii]|uniref:Metal-sensitive transcriptional regulator n=1 Tax=Promicromonospora kroppenstedtii TaxID=440482 RepID=A0ABW7XP14_9MICO
MDLDPTEMKKVANRLKRAQGQLAAVVRMVDEGADCVDMVTQLSAVSKALDRAGFAVISTGLKQCLVDEEDGSADVEKLEKLFLSFA